MLIVCKHPTLCSEQSSSHSQLEGCVLADIKVGDDWLSIIYENIAQFQVYT
jgi:hypothetical protein